MTGTQEHDGPVFVVGMNGSGTTMLLDSLGRHRELYAFPRETRLIPYLLIDSQRFGNLGDDENFRALWDEARSLPAFVFVNGSRPLPLPPDWRKCPRSVAAVLDRIFLAFASREGKRRWCEKTPQHVQHIGCLADAFPEASFIHVIRDGRDCAASFKRRWGRTPELSIYRWKKVVAEGRYQGALIRSERYMEVRYEDITGAPEHWLRRLCEFLSIPFDSAVLESSQPYLETAGQTKSGGGFRPNTGNWRRTFSASKVAGLERIGGAMLERLGYEMQTAGGDYDPHPLKRWLWSNGDMVRQYLREIVLKLRGRIERPWHVILIKPWVSRTQRRANRY